MNKEIFRGNWNQFKGKVKEKWGRLTQDDLDVIDGQIDQLVGLVQKRYGIAKMEAEKECQAFLESLERVESSR